MKVLRAVRISVLLVSWVTGCRPLASQSASLGSPVVYATAKGPNQINLTWPAISDPGYGYLVEIKSEGDVRYSAWQELRPIPVAGGYTCDSTVVIKGATCRISDPDGVHVYNPPTNGIPYWVTESNYIDPQDSSPAQFIAAGLQPNTVYSFRIRSYSGVTSTVYGQYSNTAVATTSNYTRRYVSPAGNDSNSGADDSHAWRTLSHAAKNVTCGQVLIVKGGDYPSDQLSMGQVCSAESKVVVLVSPGDKAIITSAPANADNVVVLAGAYIVVDGLIAASSSAQNGDYDISIRGNHNALFGVETHPFVVPAAKGGVAVRGDHNLVYGSYLHDAFSPDATQNPSGNGGFVLTLEGIASTNNVIWSNHLTRGGHDVSLCIRGCSYNRWLNNIMDGGWGMAWEAIDNSQFNLVEGSFIKDVGQLVSFYKPSIEVSHGHNTIRRNIAVNGKNVALEVSALNGGSTTAHSLIYNNIFYNVGSCYFQSHNGGTAAYDNIIVANNICYKFPDAATDIYLGNTASQIVYNDFLSVDTNGKPQPNKEIIIWNHEAQSTYQYPQTLAYADKTYSPPFSHNKELATIPRFVDESELDFHLAVDSPLIGAGTEIVDRQWGSSRGLIDLGAFGINAERRIRQVTRGRPK